jgi:hypothetical protein
MQQVEARLTEQGRATAVILLADQSPTFYQWVAGELQRYLRLLTGAELPIVLSSGDVPVGSTRLIVGGPSVHPVTRDAQAHGLVDFTGLKPDGFILRRLFLDGAPSLIIGGNDERATMYAAYALLEQLGLVFQLTGDVIPECAPTLALPDLDVREEPEIKYRGLHMRHFVMPWMGLDDFQRLVDQLVKLKYNYLEFFWYIGSPWVEYCYRGEPKLIGDMYSPESGYTAWRMQSGTFTYDDVAIGREQFTGRKPCAPEFQPCDTPEDAYRVARQMLTAMIRYAHERKLEIWLGVGDCPGVPANLGRYAGQGEYTDFGRMIPPGDPAGVEIWSAQMRSIIETYPEADGYWMWLAEGYYRFDDAATNAVLSRYDHLRPLLPALDELRAMGYDQYLVHVDEERQANGDLGLVHYGKTLAEALRAAYPDARLGVSVLGRSYLFPALDAVLPAGVALQSMESGPVWNRTSGVPMQNFGGLTDRDTFLVPRLSDDEDEFALQCNTSIYDHDRVLSGSREFSVAGIALQVGRTRGLEHNARYAAEGCWDTTLSPQRFYEGYCRRLFGLEATDLLCEAYQRLEALELFLSVEVDLEEVGHCFQGLGNFINYGDSWDVTWMGRHRESRSPCLGPDPADERHSAMLRTMRYRLQRFTESLTRLDDILTVLRQASPLVKTESQQELGYLIHKTEAYRMHLQALNALMQGHLTMDAAFQAEAAGKAGEALTLLQSCQTLFHEGHAMVEQTARKVASCIDHPGERYLLFRYNVRLLLPTQAFLTFVRNVVNFRQGLPYWEPVDWQVIAMPAAGAP